MSLFTPNIRDIKSLLRQGADTEQRNEDGQTPLIYATIQDWNDIVELLLRADANVNAVDNENKSALFHAVESDNAKIIHTLIDGGANINMKYNEGNNILMIACTLEEDRFEDVKYLLENTKLNVNEVNDHGATALMQCAMMNNAKCAQVLIDNGADINIKDYEGYTAIDYATEGQNFEVLKVLMDVTPESSEFFKEEKDLGKSVKVLGQGTYGIVEKYVNGNKISAVKKMFGYNDSSLREASSLVFLNPHPFIADLTGVIFKRNDIWIEMPVAAGSLQDLIFRNIAQYDPKTISYQLVNAVGYCHSKDLYHRDIKPGNILYMSDGSIKLADFGMARTNNCSDVLKNVTNLVYTLYYRPPEIVLGGTYNDKADMWAVGCVIYELYNKKYCFETFDKDTILPNFDSVPTMKNFVSKLLSKDDYGNYAQFFTITAKIGAPENSGIDIPEYKIWNERVNYPRWREYSNAMIPFKGRTFASIQTSDPEQFSLITKCLCYDPKKRASAYELLNDPIFRGFGESSAFLTCREKNAARDFPGRIGEFKYSQNYFNDLDNILTRRINDTSDVAVVLYAVYLYVYTTKSGANSDVSLLNCYLLARTYLLGEDNSHFLSSQQIVDILVPIKFNLVFSTALDMYGAMGNEINDNVYYYFMMSMYSSVHTSYSLEEIANNIHNFVNGKVVSTPAIKDILLSFKFKGQKGEQGYLNIMAENEQDLNKKLFDAVKKNDYKTVDEILNDPNANIDNEYKVGGNSALMIAVYNGFLPIVQRLIDYGMWNDDDDKHLRHLAKEGGDQDVIDYINENFPEDDWNGALIEAITQGDSEKAERLINDPTSSFDPSGYRIGGKTAFMLAVQRDEINIVNLLIQHELYDLDLTDDEGNTVLELAEKYASEEMVKIIESLM